MKIDIYRKHETARSIVGEFWVDGQKECFCLEPARSNPVHPGHPCVTAGGPYKVELTFSPHLGYVCPEVFEVTGRSDIRIHKGNKPEDTLGCTLLGTSVGPAPDWISDSHDAFDKVMALLKTSDAITVEYHDV
ncbi:MAG TPA: DUF5675 family protein, partial [Candidatus Sulfotelmatobacter sp.]